MNRLGPLYIFMFVGTVLLVGTVIAIDRAHPVRSSRPTTPTGPSAAEEVGEQYSSGTALTAAQEPDQRSAPPPRRAIRRPARPLASRPMSAKQPPPISRPSPSPPAPPPETREAWGTHPQDQAATGQEVQPDTLPPVERPAALPSPPPVLTPPVLLTSPSVYPSEGYHIVLERGQLSPQVKIAALEGRLVLRMLVRADGSVARVKIAQSSGYEMLDQAAVSAAWAWRFTPATRGGVPIDAWVMIPVRFVVR